MVVMGRSNRGRSKDNIMIGMLVLFMQLKPNMTFEEFLEYRRKKMEEDQHLVNGNKK